MTEGRCATCRWWYGRFGGSDDEQPDPRDWADWGACELPTTDEDGKMGHPTALFQASGLTTMGADLLTKRDFGCVQWEAKP